MNYERMIALAAIEKNALDIGKIFLAFLFFTGGDGDKTWWMEIINFLFRIFIFFGKENNWGFTLLLAISEKPGLSLG